MQSNDLLTQRNYPLQLKFKIGTVYNDFVATDAVGNTVAYVRQKIFKLKEHVIVYSNEQKEEILFEIRANKWLDFNTAYSFTDALGNPLGRVVRKGWKSIMKAHYIIYDEHDQTDLVINEKNAWVKVWDALFSEIPVLGMLSGYLFNPAYEVRNTEGSVICTLKKQKSFFGRRFELTNQTEMDAAEEDRVLLSLMMMILLERRRG